MNSAECVYLLHMSGDLDKTGPLHRLCSPAILNGVHMITWGGGASTFEGGNRLETIFHTLSHDLLCDLQ